MRRHAWIYVLALLLIAACVCVILHSVEETAANRPIVFIGFTNTFTFLRSSKGFQPSSNWLDFRVTGPLSLANGMVTPSKFEIVNFEGTTKGGVALFKTRVRSVIYFQDDFDSDGERFLRFKGQPPGVNLKEYHFKYPGFYKIGLNPPITLPREPWRLLVQIRGDLPGRTNRLAAFVRTVGQKCGFNMANAEWLDSRIWVDIPGKP